MNLTIENFWEINSEAAFEKAALQLFYQQAQHCRVYAEFLKHLGFDKQAILGINEITQIPFLPVSFFKNQLVLDQRIKITDKAITFSSSGTTGMVQSKHIVPDASLYEKSFNTAFEKFYGNLKDACFLALLPSYLEREGSSLIYMAEALIHQSEQPASGFFLDDLKQLRSILLYNKEKAIPTILLGVTYALLDFIEVGSISFPELIVMETGGMKGKRKEMIRPELHEILRSGFGVEKIHSEYGMTELLSQAYSKGDGLFTCPPWMKVLLREPNDPFTIVKNNQAGGINIIDLANVHSCAFIATQDLGKLLPDGRFEVLGRFDQSDLRGCNLLVQ
ncbi:MAG: acyl transferase [Pedobacter sp.]|nr:MAG: acyl transferase [Pedobacter sp.]